MKIAIKLAVVGVALAGAVSAHADILPNTGGTAAGSNLMLFVSNLSKNVFFARDLGNQLDTIYSNAQITTDGALAPGTFKTFSTPTSFAGADAALQAFLATPGFNLATDNIQWVIFADSKVGSGITLARQRSLVTSTNDLSTASAAFQNTQVNTFVSKLNPFVTNIDANFGTSNVSTYGGFADGNAATGGANSEQAWVNSGVGGPLGSALGSAQTMYLFATNGAGGTFEGNAYVGGIITVGTDGVISVNNGSAAVPVPAAVWLLGSGLLGLLGVGRRRRAA